MDLTAHRGMAMMGGLILIWMSVIALQAEAPSEADFLRAAAGAISCGIVSSRPVAAL